MAASAGPRIAYELPSTPATTGVDAIPTQRGTQYLPEPLLVRHVVWFVQLRWIAIALLVLLSIKIPEVRSSKLALLEG